MIHADNIGYAGMRERLKSLHDGFVILIVSEPNKYEETNIEILKLLCNSEKLPGVYVTVNHPYHSIFKKLVDSGVSTENLFFIDLITKTRGENPMRTKNCLFISSPENVTDLGIAIDEAIYVNSHKKFLFLDSVSALLIYNSAGTVKEFEHFLTLRMRRGNLKGILISLSDGEREIIDFLAQFCDECITVG